MEWCDTDNLTRTPRCLYSSAASPVFVHFLFACCCFSFFQFLYVLVLLWNLKFCIEFCFFYTENMFLLSVFSSLLYFPPWLPWLVACTVTIGFKNKRGDVWRKYVFERGEPFSFSVSLGTCSQVLRTISFTKRPPAAHEWRQEHTPPEASGALLALMGGRTLTFWTSYTVLRQASVFLLEALCLRVFEFLRIFPS